jgi:hypothetical protein
MTRRNALALLTWLSRATVIGGGAAAGIFGWQAVFFLWLGMVCGTLAALVHRLKDDERRVRP